MTTFAIVCLLVLTLSIKVQFETPLGFTVPTQLAFIPLLFAVSPAVVPIAVALAFLLAQVPGLIRGTSRASRLVLQVPNAWFAIGPATVFAIAEVNPHHATVALLIIAFAAQCVVDFVVAALLHDVGKIVIPKEIINKPGKLDPEEWEIVKTHTVEGQRMLDQVGGFMREVGLIVRSHHERWDGGGYPDGLAGEQTRSRRGSSHAATPGTRCAPTARTARRWPTTSRAPS